jgi:F-type H+-transporting ATPase subunit gamma
MHGNLKEMKERLRGTRKVLQVTQAMEHISSVRLARGRSLCEAHYPYVDRLGAVLNLVAGAPDYPTHPLVTPHTPGKLALVIFGADRGLCGGYNSALLAAAESFISKNGPDIALVTIGKIIRDRLLRTGHQLDYSLLQPSFLDYPATIVEIQKHLSAGFRGGRYRDVHVLYTPYIPGKATSPRLARLLPLSITPDTNSPLPTLSPAEPRQHDLALLADAIREPAPEFLIRHMAPDFLRALLTHLFLSGCTSEQAARHAAMVRARDNASDMVEELTLACNRLRQEQITTEMSELSSGAKKP